MPLYTVHQVVILLSSCMYVSEEKMCLVRVYVRAACLGFQFKELLITRVMQITGIGLLRQNASEPNFEDISSERTAIDKPREPDSYVDELNLFAVKYWFSNSSYKPREPDSYGLLLV